MLIKGIVEYNNNGAVSEEKINMDTTALRVAESKDLLDAVAFALYGKTVFQEIVRAGKGVPLISMEINDNGKTFYVVRQPEYLRETAFGNRYLTKELFSLKTEDAEYESLSAEKYFAMLKDLISLAYEDLISLCR